MKQGAWHVFYWDDLRRVRIFKTTASKAAEALQIYRRHLPYAVLDVGKANRLTNEVQHGEF